MAAVVAFTISTFRGILLQEQKRYEEAIESYTLALQCRPRLSSEYLQLTSTCFVAWLYQFPFKIN